MLSLLALSGLAIGGWVITHPNTRDPYKFLGNRSPLSSGAIGPGSFVAKDVRVYTWKQPWREVAARARKEFAGTEIKEVPSEPESPPAAYWALGEFDAGPCGTGSDLDVFISPGKALPLTMFGDYTDYDPEWSTVIITSDLPNNWVSVVRYTLFPIPE